MKIDIMISIMIAKTSAEYTLAMNQQALAPRQSRVSGVSGLGPDIAVRPSQCVRSLSYFVLDDARECAVPDTKPEEGKRRGSVLNIAKQTKFHPGLLTAVS